MKEIPKSHEGSQTPDYDALIDKVEALLEESDPVVGLNESKTLFGIVTIPPDSSTAHRRIDLTRNSGYTSLRISEVSQYSVDDPEVKNTYHILGYATVESNSSSFLEARSLWETDLDQEALSPEDIANISDCIDGKIPVDSELFKKFNSKNAI